MKRPSLIGVLLIAALLLSLCLSACSGNNTAATEAAPAATEAAVTEVPTEAVSEMPTLEKPLTEDEAIESVLKEAGIKAEDVNNLTYYPDDENKDIEMVEFIFDGKSYTYKCNLYTGEVTQIGDAVEETDADFHKAETAVILNLPDDEREMSDVTYDRVEQDGKTLVKVVFNTNLKHHVVLYDPESDAVISDETTELQ